MKGCEIIVGFDSIAGSWSWRLESRYGVTLKRQAGYPTSGAAKDAVLGHLDEILAEHGFGFWDIPPSKAMRR